MNIEEQQYLLGYLIESANDENFKEHIRRLKIELDWHVYYYGEHFERKRDKDKKFFSVKKQLIRLYQQYIIPFISNVEPNEKNVLSTIYFSDFNKALKDINLNPISPSWMPLGKNIIGTWSLTRTAERIQKKIKNYTFAQLISPSFQNEVSNFSEAIASFLGTQHLSAAFLYTDQYLNSKLIIDAFHRLKRPSFILSHGLPGIYDLNVDNRSDYLLVWGQSIRENYINAGFNKEKIFVAGHPGYHSMDTSQATRFGLEDVLVLAKASSPHQHNYQPILSDRGNIIIYLLKVKEALMSLGIKQARLRPHPTMSTDWLISFLGNDFYKADTLPLDKSIRKASLVIGPTSTVLLESVFNGVNYLIFEPSVNGRDLMGYDHVAPFNGNEPGIPVAKTVEELIYLIKNTVKVSPEVLKSYLTPFDITFIRNLL